MKLNVRRFKDLSVALKQLEPIFRAYGQVKSGRPLEKLGRMLPREAMVNWLICAVLTDASGRPHSFTTDPTGGDGIIYDDTNEVAYPTEHIFVPWVSPEQTSTTDIRTLIFEAVAKKEARGVAYSGGRTLVVYLDPGRGAWNPNKIARELPAGNFSTVWVVSPNNGGSDGAFVYGVTCVRTGDGVPIAPIWILEIAPSFETWTVRAIQ